MLICLVRWDVGLAFFHHLDRVDMLSWKIILEVTFAFISQIVNIEADDDGTLTLASEGEDAFVESAFGEAD
jgi:hypothetical protein